MYHDRKIKKFSYEVGDFVLVDHPHLKKGLSRGIAHKYYGPFVIKKRRENGVDYFLQRVGKRKGRIYQLHQNRLKAYEMHADADGSERQNESSDDEAEPRRKRTYKKNLQNPRWKKKAEKHASTSESSSDSEMSPGREHQTKKCNVSGTDALTTTDGEDDTTEGDTGLPGTSKKLNPEPGLYGSAREATTDPKKADELSEPSKTAQNKLNPGLGLYGPAGDDAPSTVVPKKRGRPSMIAQNKFKLNPKPGLYGQDGETPSNEAKSRSKRARKPPDRLVM